MMTAEKASWGYLPTEIRLLILEVLLQDGCSLAGFATVSREWQATIERHNFARIKLTGSRLTDFGSIIPRNRALVRYIWLCLELEKYRCLRCHYVDLENWRLSENDDILIFAVFKNLFSTLSRWEPNGNLLLDISVHSPSDPEHWFKYLTFRPDIPPDEWERSRCTERTIKVEHDHHSWDSYDMDRYAGFHDMHPYAILNLFTGIGNGGQFINDEQEKHWWQQLL